MQILLAFLAKKNSMLKGSISSKVHGNLRAKGGILLLKIV